MDEGRVGTTEASLITESRDRGGIMASNVLGQRATQASERHL